MGLYHKSQKRSPPSPSNKQDWLNSKLSDFLKLILNPQSFKARDKVVCGIYNREEARAWLESLHISRTVVVKVLFDALRFSSTKVSKEISKNFFSYPSCLFFLINSTGTTLTVKKCLIIYFMRNYSLLNYISISGVLSHIFGHSEISKNILLLCLNY